jgi:hypothetical protein
MLLGPSLLAATAATATPAAPSLPPPEPAALAAQSKSKKAPTGPATALSWTFAEVRAIRRDVDASDDSYNGWSARGAFELGQGVFALGGAELDSGDADVTRYDLGLGHHVLLAPEMDAHISAEWVHFELDGAGAADFSKDGWRAEVGLRQLVDKALEFDARVGWEDIGTDGLIWGLDLRYWFLEHASMGLGYEREIDDGVWALSLRYAF